MTCSARSRTIERYLSNLLSRFCNRCPQDENLFQCNSVIRCFQNRKQQLCQCPRLVHAKHGSVHRELCVYVNGYCSCRSDAGQPAKKQLLFGQQHGCGDTDKYDDIPESQNFTRNPENESQDKFAVWPHFYHQSCCKLCSNLPPDSIVQFSFLF